MIIAHTLLRYYNIIIHIMIRRLCYMIIPYHSVDNAYDHVAKAPYHSVDSNHVHSYYNDLS